jgi:hypothetical protein
MWTTSARIRATVAGMNNGASLLGKLLKAKRKEKVAQQADEKRPLSTGDTQRPLEHPGWQGREPATETMAESGPDSQTFQHEVPCYVPSFLSVGG